MQITRSVFFLATLVTVVTSAFASPYTLRDTGLRTGTSDTVQIRGLGAGAFSADDWTSAPPNLVADVRRPLLEPRPGKFRNIYAPSALAMADGGWSIYYGGWDGIAEGHDHIYVTTTTDFLTFGPRTQVIQPGSYDHICNVNAQRNPDSAHPVSLMCTLYPDANDRNKPALFNLSESVLPASLTAAAANIVNVNSYPNYGDADINGMNVLLRDGERSLMYFGDFKNFGTVYVAQENTETAADAADDDGAGLSVTQFNLLGAALTGRYAVNDVKKLRGADNVSGGASSADAWYLMGLHMNGGNISYSLSQDALHFPAAKVLCSSSGEDDKYIVAVGFVTDEQGEAGARQLSGVLYGASAVPSLDANRIFARWFQKTLSFHDGEARQIAPVLAGALGPDAQVFRLPDNQWQGAIRLASENGSSVSVIPEATLQSGHIYEIISEGQPLH